MLQQRHRGPAPRLPLPKLKTVWGKNEFAKGKARRGGNFTGSPPVGFRFDVAVLLVTAVLDSWCPIARCPSLSFAWKTGESACVVLNRVTHTVILMPQI